MCLIVFAWNHHPKYKLIVAANRDEFYTRGTVPVSYWENDPNVLAGRDLKSGGTWMGVTKSGRWTAVTNYRDLGNIKQNAPSRGELTSNFLKESMLPQQYIQTIKPTGHWYNGFNLLVGDTGQLIYYSNQLKDEVVVTPGVYGLSNHLMDTPWPKVEKAKTMFKKAIDNNEVSIVSLFGLLYDSDTYPDHLLPRTGLSLEEERALSAIFIKMKGYGSHSSTVLMITHQNDVLFAERQYQNGIRGNDSVFRFTIET